jgi:hypothetical protein
MRGIQERVTYANVTATLALFLALGGTSYALTLPRNSVGSQQIRSKAVGASELRAGSVRSSDVKDRSLRIQDLSRRARASLRGAAGPAGPPGPAGITYRSAVTASGALVRGNARGSDARGINGYLISFDTSVAECISTATLANVDGGDPPPGRITVGREGGGVIVRTYDAAGNPAALPFHLIVAC